MAKQPDPTKPVLHFKLNYPVNVGGMVLSELHVPRLKAKHLWDIEQDIERKTGTVLTMIASAAEVDLEAMRELDAEDVQRLVDAVVPFWGFGPKTGENT